LKIKIAAAVLSAGAGSVTQTVTKC